MPPDRPTNADLSDMGHLGLDLLGAAPVFGEPADAANGMVRSGGERW